MSFILDALRKSEHARQHLGGATLAELPLGRRPRSQPWWVIALAALLLINLLVLTLVLVRKTPESPAAVQSSAAIAPQAARSSSPPATKTTSPTPLAEEAASPPNVQYETIPRAESPLDVPPLDGPTLVKPIDKAAAVPAAPITTASGLPELRIDMHVYAKEPKDRFVFINMHKYTEGQTIAEGPRIAEITANGVTLWYRSQEFSLPRP